MRIAFISTILGYPWGSPDRLWTELADRCLQREDAVFLGISSLTADHDDVRALQSNGAEIFIRTENSVYRGSRDTITRTLPWNRRSYLEYQLSAFAPDVVLITQGATYDSLAEHHLRNWIQRHRVPYVVICHNNASGAALTQIDAQTVRAFLGAASKTLFVSTQNRQLAEQQLARTLTRTDLVQNPLSALTNSALPFPIQSDTPVFGIVGRIDIHHKGLDLLFEAIAGLESPIRLILTGRVEEPDELQSLLLAYGLKDQIEIRGAVKSSQVTQAYAEMELFILSSRYEGCASSMIEALMCGRPVLATNVGGVSDWISNGVEGFVATEVSAPAIQSTLARALKVRSHWASMGTAARARFDLQRVQDPVDLLLREVDAVVGQIIPT